jgi:hypothetical protein
MNRINPMNKIYAISLIIILSAFSSFGQSYTRINQVAVQQNNTFINQNNNSGLNNIAYSISSFRNALTDEKVKTREIEKAKSQLAIIKNLYSERTTFPETIIDGWHSVKVTDNFNYCSDAKVLVNENEIKQMVIENYAELSLVFTPITGIKNAKSTVNINLKNGTTDTAEIYFLYDLDKPNTTSEPLQAGYVTFWSDLRNAKTIEIWFKKQKQGKIEKQLENADCFTDGGLTLKLKPGSYDFKAESRGAKSWSGTIEIRENECYTYSLNKKNKD